MLQVPTVLFVCTANLYRSRVAEALFNHHAQARSLGWCAFSRGLDPRMTEMDGLAPHAETALRDLQIERHHTAATKTPLTAEDLAMAHLIIAMSREEHQPMIQSKFPEWAEQFNFWEIEDTHLLPAEKAVPQIAQVVGELVEEISSAGED